MELNKRAGAMLQSQSRKERGRNTASSIKKKTDFQLQTSWIGNITESTLCQLALWGPSLLLSLQFSQHVSDESNGDHVWLRAAEVIGSY